MIEVTEGPWVTEIEPSDPNASDMVTVGRVGDFRFGPRTRVNGGNYRDYGGATDEDEAEFICDAVNACFEINPANPSAVAAEIGEAFRLVKYFGSRTGTTEQTLQWFHAECKALLQRIQTKSGDQQ